MDANSMFETAALVATIQELRPPEMHFYDKFFSERVNHETEYVAVDVEKGGRAVASFVSPLHEAKTVAREGREAKVYAPAYIKEKLVTKAGDMLRRNAGEQLFGSVSPEQRASDQLAKDLMTLQMRIMRRWELMCIEALVDAKQTVTGEGQGGVVDFQRDNALTHQVSTLWSNSAANPLDDLATYARNVKQKSGLNVTDVYLGSDAARDFITRSGSLLDTRRSDLGQIDPRQLPQGVTYLGTLKRPAVDVYEYSDWYYDGSSEVAVFPAKKALLVAGGARKIMHYGVIQDLAGLAPVPLFPKSWEQEDPSARFVMLQSAPLAVNHQPNGTALLTVLT